MLSFKSLAKGIADVAVPAEADSAHQAYAGNALVLSRICALQHNRKLTKDLIQSFNKQCYILQTKDAPRYALRGKAVSVVSYTDGRIKILNGNELTVAVPKNRVARTSANQSYTGFSAKNHIHRIGLTSGLRT